MRAQCPERTSGNRFLGIAFGDTNAYNRYNPLCTVLISPSTTEVAQTRFDISENLHLPVSSQQYFTPSYTQWNAHFPLYRFHELT